MAVAADEGRCPAFLLFTRRRKLTVLLKMRRPEMYFRVKVR